MKYLQKMHKKTIYCAIMITWLVLAFSFIAYIMIKVYQMYPPNIWLK